MSLGHRSPIPGVTLAVCLTTMPVGAYLSADRTPQKPRVGIGHISVSYPESVEELWRGANAVVEVFTRAKLAAFECDPQADSKIACTPHLVEVRQVFKNDSGLVLSPGKELTVVQKYGRVETNEYYIDTPGPEFNYLELGRRHFLFLTCSVSTGRCTIEGYVFKVNGRAIENKAAPVEILALGEPGLRGKLIELGRQK
jgi:hypothetical protein